jgi:thiol-disulfide isomerase/thioredoxin
MHKMSLITLFLLILQYSSGQTESPVNNINDPFSRMIKTIHSIDALGFDAQFNIKQVFETDTITALARVTVIKEGNRISFLQIIPVEGDLELIYCNDSAWVVDHQAEKMDCIGTSADALASNNMSNFFSFTLFSIDTMIMHVEPFWHVSNENDTVIAIAVDIGNHSDDVTDVRVEFTIRKSDYLPFKTMQESVYLKADKLFQEQVFTNYRFPDPSQVRPPEYFNIYGKDLSIFRNNDPQTDTSGFQVNADVYLEDIELFDLSGNPFPLPDEGLIFLDFWYVGCAPCMRSAPVIEELYGEFRDKVYFFSINEVDQNNEKISGFCQKMGISFPVLLGGKEKLAGKINRDGGYPVFVLLDAGSQKVIWYMTGYRENLKEVVSDMISKYL